MLIRPVSKEAYNFTQFELLKALLLTTTWTRISCQIKSNRFNGCCRMTFVFLFVNFVP